MEKIEDYLPEGMNARKIQKDIFRQIEENLDKYKFFLIKAPTGAGKTVVAYAIAKWANARLKSASITMHRKSLQDQYAEQFPDIPILKGMSTYSCRHNASGKSCGAVKKSRKKICVKDGVPDCTWFFRMKRCEEALSAIYNLHSYYYNNQYKQYLIADEAHNILPFLTDLYSIKIKHNSFPYPSDIEDYKVTEKYLKDLVGAVQEEIDKIEGVTEGTINDVSFSNSRFNLLEADKDLEELLQKYSDLEAKFRANPEGFMVKTHTVKGERELVIGPKNLKTASSSLWPENSSDHVEKIFLLSATFSDIDMENLNIPKEQVLTIETDSPIPPERRPFLMIPAYEVRGPKGDIAPYIAQAIGRIVEKHSDEKGIIHTTYEIAEHLKRYLISDRYIWHYPDDAQIKLDLYLNSKTPKILVACGMEEGLDLKDDLARFQIITTTLFPFLGEPLWKWKADNANLEYTWEAIRKIIQQSGRISRNEKDFGVTYMLDGKSARLFNKRYADLWPKWFLQSAAGVANLDKALEKEWKR